MSHHDAGQSQPYSFGRDRPYYGAHDHRGHQFTTSHSEAQSSVGPHHPSASHVGHHQGVPPPPAGYRSLFTVVVLYLAGGFMLLWTGASAAVTIEAMGGRDSEEFMIGLFMTVASLLITAGAGAWLIRIHRRRSGYRRILDQHYAQRFGYDPG